MMDTTRKFTWDWALLLALNFGYFFHQVTSQAAPAMTAPPLFNSGAQSGDVEIENIIDSTTVSLTFNITYLGFNYSKLFISADGTVGFEKAVDYHPDVRYFGGIRNPTVDVPFVAPLLYSGYRPRNMEASIYQGKISYRAVDISKVPTADKFYTSHKQICDYLGPYLRDSIIHGPASLQVKYLIIVTWNNVAEAVDAKPCSASSLCKGASFQVVLAGDNINTFAIFNYNKYDITVKDNYEAGFNAGRGRGWYNVLSCHGGCATYMPTYINNLKTYQGCEQKGRYIFSVGQETVVRGGCLPKEIVAGILEIYPRTVGMFGGEKLQVSGLCGAPNAKIFCRFGTAAARVSRVVEGAMITANKGYCQVPLLTTTGNLDVYWSNDNKTWTADRSIHVVPPSRIGDPAVVDQSVKAAWFRRDSKEITVKWDNSKFGNLDNKTVEVKLIGYKENSSEVEYRELAKLGSPNNQSSYTFKVEQHKCKKHCEEFEIGLLEVILPVQSQAKATERIAQRFGPIPLGWYMNEELVGQLRPHWSDEKCREWYDSDQRDRKWLDNLLSCPCSLDQALADFGRWQADPGCNLFTGSHCLNNKGAKHCVLSVVPTKDGAGNQCCYNPDGTLKHSQLSHEGSTPDRSHVWGASPYNAPDRVPELSHWKHDVISFYYCCLWNNYDLCDLYTELRPTRDCRDYDVPGIGSIHGHTHVTTFDGLRYHFTGSGDYLLAQYDILSFHVQGKFQPRDQNWDIGKLQGTTTWKPKALTAIAMSSGHKKVEVSIAPAGVRLRRALDVRVDGELRYFVDKVSYWQDFQELIVINNAPENSSNHHDNFTFLLTTFNVGIRVEALNGLLHVTLAVPPTFKPPHTSKPNMVGLLGAFDTNPDNDFQPRSGAIVSPALDKKTINDKFALSWKLVPDDYKIFQFDNIADPQDAAHAYFEYSLIPATFPGAPNQSRVTQFCGGSENCKYSFQITGDENVAKVTKDFDGWLVNLRRSAYREDSCGLPEVGLRANLSSNDFSVNSSVKVTACGHGRYFRGSATFKCVSENLEEARKRGRAEYGTVRTDNTNKEGYIIRWEPKPYIVCAGSPEAPDVPLIVGAVLGAAAFIALTVVITVFIVRRRRRDGKVCSITIRRKKPTEHNVEDAVSDPATTEAMLPKPDDPRTTEPDNPSTEELEPDNPPATEPRRVREISL